jgi:hypothetical protein
MRKVEGLSGMWERGENTGVPALTDVRFAGFSPIKPDIARFQMGKVDAPWCKTLPPQ